MASTWSEHPLGLLSDSGAFLQGLLTSVCDVHTNMVAAQRIVFHSVPAGANTMNSFIPGSVSQLALLEWLF